MVSFRGQSTACTKLAAQSQYSYKLEIALRILGWECLCKRVIELAKSPAAWSLETLASNPICRGQFSPARLAVPALLRTMPVRITRWCLCRSTKEIPKRPRANFQPRPPCGTRRIPICPSSLTFAGPSPNSALTRDNKSLAHNRSREFLHPNDGRTAVASRCLSRAPKRHRRNYKSPQGRASKIPLS